MLNMMTDMKKMKGRDINMEMTKQFAIAAITTEKVFPKIFKTEIEAEVYRAKNPILNIGKWCIEKLCIVNGNK